MSLQPGRKLAHYEIVEPIGKGGMGEVYRARDSKLGRDVAIKVLPDELAQDKERLERFQREAQVLASLNHPNIASIYGVEESEGTHCLVLELVGGVTLSERIARSPIPVDEAREIALQIAEALEEAHAHGIVHRDLTPENIKLTPDGKVKVLDFGLAKTFAEDPTGAEDSNSPMLAREVTRAGALLGTAPYMSPEQARGQDVDERSDIWSFGCVLWECLTRQKLFGGPTLSDSIGAILHTEPDWGRLPADTPPTVRRLLRRCLAKDLRQRLHHIADARIELEDPDPPPPAAGGSTRGYRIAVTVLAVALIAGLTAALLYFSRPAAGTSDPGGENPLAGARFSKIADFKGTGPAAAISPDGRFVAFVSARDGPLDLFVDQIDLSEFSNLTQDRAEFALGVGNFGFNGDGSEIWLGGGPDPLRMKSMPLLGGPARNFLGKDVVKVAWSPDREHLVYYTNETGDPVYVADRYGRNSRLLPLGSPQGMHQHDPIWSVDGQWIYLTRGRSALEMDLWRVRPNGGELEQLTRRKLDARSPTPIDERTVLYSARKADGAGPWLWAVDVETRISRRASLGLEQYASVAASADRRRLVATVQDSRAGLWSVPILDHPATETDAEPFADLPTARALAPRFGGSSLFYLSSRGGGDGLWRYAGGQIAEI